MAVPSQSYIWWLVIAMRFVRYWLGITMQASRKPCHRNGRRSR